MKRSLKHSISKPSAMTRTQSIQHRLAPLTLALLMVLDSTAVAQISVSSNDRSSLPSKGGATSAPPSYLSLRDRVRSPVNELRLSASSKSLPADGQSAIEVDVDLLGANGQRLTQDITVTLEVTGGARILVPRRLTSESQADASDVDRIVPATQLRTSTGKLQFKLLAPMQPGDITLRASAEGVQVDLSLQALPDEREMFAVGLVELQARRDKVDASELIPARENDGFDRELRNWRREFGNGKAAVAGRAAVYLKGMIRGDALLTLAYDSDKEDTKRLFEDIDPQALYAVYGDSSVRGIDTQSSSRLYVRLDKKRNYLLYGDYNSSSGGAGLATYSRSLTGVKAYGEHGAVTGTIWAARDTLRQVVDEIPARGVSGPYSLSNPNGVQGTEKVELVVRDRNQPSVILRITQLARFSDYEFEPFSGKILFRAPVPSIDDQLNPVSIRVTYEVEQGGTKYNVAGGDIKLKLSDALTLGASAAKDNNPTAPYQVVGASVEARLSQSTAITAEVAQTKGTPSSGLGAAGTVAPSAAIDKSGSAAKVELRHEGERLQGRVLAAKAEQDFDNPAAGITGGRTELSAQGMLRLTQEWALKAEVIRSKDTSVANSVSAQRDAKGAQVGVEYRPTDNLTLEVGARRTEQNAQALLQGSVTGCTTTGSSSQPGTPGFNSGNAGFGINPNGGQRIDPNTGLPVVCAGTSLAEASPAAEEVTNNALYARARYDINSQFSVFGELQRDKSETAGAESAQTLYSLGGEYRPYDKTRIYLRHDRSRNYTGLFGLGAGEGTELTTLGIDTEYLPDASVFSEYRLRDAIAGREVQHAVGLRNGWMLAEGLKLTTGAERLKTRLSNTAQSSDALQRDNTAIALSTGLEYTANPLWKASGRVEWRRDNNNENWLSTAGFAGKLNRDWTFIARNYYYGLKPRQAAGRQTQDRLQFGFAYRPVDRNDLDTLGLYEFKTEKDSTGATGGDNTNRDVNIVSLRVNWHPSRPWWLSGRIAVKDVDESLVGVQSRYTANIVSGRVMYDLTNRWSLGAHASVLRGAPRDAASTLPQSTSRQYAYGLEAGYVMRDNLLLVLGHTWRGFSDRDLAQENYTNRGWYLGLRYKFDEDMFHGRNPAVNKTLPPEPATAPSPSPAPSEAKQ